MAERHRKRVQHFEVPGHAHELTFSCYQRMPLLEKDHWRSLLAQSIRRATVRHRYRLIAFVFMPEHVYLLVFPERDASSVPDLLRAIKRPYSFRIKQILTESGDDLLSQLTIHQRPGVTTFRYWQEGPGYDRNITDAGTVVKVIDYIHENPVRRNLCQRAADWQWSSARHFVDSTLPVDPALPPLSPLPPEFMDSGSTP